MLRHRINQAPFNVTLLLANHIETPKAFHPVDAKEEHCQSRTSSQFARCDFANPHSCTNTSMPANRIATRQRCTRTSPKQISSFLSTYSLRRVGSNRYSAEGFATPQSLGRLHKLHNPAKAHVQLPSIANIYIAFSYP